MTDRSALSQVIIKILSENDEICGGGNLAMEYLHCANLTWVRTLLRRLEAAGEITITKSNSVNCGRGHKLIVRKRNRNSAGQPRKVRV